MSDDLLKKLGARLREERDAAGASNGLSSLSPGAPSFDTAAEERIVTRLLAESGGAPSGAAGPSAAGPKVPVAPQPLEAPAERVVRPRRWLWTTAPILAAAAAIVLFIIARPPRASQLPHYEISVVSANDQRARPAAPNPAAIRLDPEGDLELTARPRVAARGVAARAVLIRDGSASVWRAPIELSRDGALRIAGETRALFPETSGEYEIVVIVAGPDELPSEDEAVRIATAGEAAGERYRVLRTKVRFVGGT